MSIILLSEDVNTNSTVELTASVPAELSVLEPRQKAQVCVTLSANTNNIAESVTVRLATSDRTGI